MIINEVAKYAWDHAIEMKFGGKDVFDSDTFLCNWITKNYPGVWVKGGASGLYWFLVKNKTTGDLKVIKRPQNFPKRGTDISQTVVRNEKIFKENLCNPDKDKFLVIYNGHEKNVFSRIRSHFSLNNDKTTAIGFGKYSISEYDLRVRIFHNKLPMDNLKDDDKTFIKELLGEKAGREAVESSWRAFNGWPVLCNR